LALADSGFVVVSNGFADGPAQALRDYLLRKRARQLTTIFHPLLRGDGPVHVISLYERGKLVSTKSVRLPSKPPLTYSLDLFVPPWPPAADVWFGFNATACLRGLAARRIGRSRKVVYWCVDYVDHRFGNGALTRAYEWLDGVCCRQADARFELSSAGVDARNRRHASQHLAPSRVVPMGSWTQDTPKTTTEAWEKRRVVYLGHLVPRQGVARLIDAIALLNSRGFRVYGDIVGRGPLEDELRRQAHDAGLDGIVRFHGFIEDHREVEVLLAGCTMGAAPYLTGIGSFTQFTDPGKLKAYLGAGLPIVLTPVPPIARELADTGAAVIVDDSAESLAEGIRGVLTSGEDWQRRREAALAQARLYDWEVILADALRFLGFAPN
jgi:glycosyltransferase involved in cell wall biosynthesis